MKTKLSQLLTLDYKGQKYVVGAAALFAAVAYLFVVAPQIMAAVLVAALALVAAGLVMTHIYPTHPWSEKSVEWLAQYGLYTQALLSALLGGFLFLSLFVSPAALTVAVVYTGVCAYLEYLASQKASAVDVMHDRTSGIDAPVAEPVPAA